MTLIKKNKMICGAVCLALLLGFFVFKEMNERLKLGKEAARAEEGVSVSATVRQMTTPEIITIPSAPSGGGGGGMIATARGADIFFRGYAQPRALVTFKKDGNVMATCAANDKGEFFQVITGLPSNFYVFNVFSVDEHGRNSVTLNFRMQVEENTRSEIVNLFIPPTVSISSNEVRHKELLYFSGQTIPRSAVTLLIQPENILKTFSAKDNGEWEYWLETVSFKTGGYVAKFSAKTSWGLDSQFGEAVSFKISAEAPGCDVVADINCDGKVTTADLSILLYWWGRNDFGKNSRVDLNRDKKINLTDFSILLYWWRKLR